ncbi:beta-propeller fold lactonase family protein [Fulvimarina sp. 2208YS6-2-32]|nr:beta-propeller fold lactonase family protein [Fulvimarina sp. 2208YS6-2-32]
MAALAFGSPAHAGERAFVTNQDGETVSIVELDTMEVIGSIPMDGKPAGIAVTDRYAYVSRPEAKAIGVIDLRSGAVLPDIETGGGPLGIAVHPSGSPVYVADWFSHSLLVVDPETRTVTARFETGESPSGVAVSADGTMIVTADRDSDQVSFIDAKTGEALARVGVGKRPFGVTISPDQRRVYAVNVGSDDVTVLDMTTREILATVPVGSHPYAAAEANVKVFVTDQYGGTLSVFDAGTYRALGEIAIGEYPEGIEASADGRFVYVANWFDGTLAKVDTDTLDITETVDVGNGPRAFGNFIAGKATGKDKGR